jgi:ribosomal protein L4
VFASRNIERVFMIDNNSLNAFNVVRHENVILSDNATKTVVSRLTDNGEENEM